ALMDRRPKQLSGGQRQRVAIGRAIVREPKVFLFDEPLSNLDAKLRVEMRSEIKLLHKRLGITTVYVTHDQIEAMTLGDKIAVMKDGVVQQFGSPDAIYRRPVNTFVASFMGSPPMNLIPITLAVQDGVAQARFKVGEQDQLLSLRGFAVDAIAPLANASAPLLMGLRPEHMTDDGRAGSSGETLTVAVDLAEPTGADTLVFTTLGGVRVVCRLHPLAAIGRDHVDLRVDTSQAVLFDAASGRAVAFSG
ncbi:MAG TPA: ATP-binding cassette domain-containing protein, partial [Burkholderiaceae bacterium]|nr:ATP-binding cassette domain-containing protein [Burkholderiaceae bacterium]